MRKSAGLIVTVAAAFFAFCSISSAQKRPRPWIAPGTGVWMVTAKDEDGTDWSGRLHLSRAANKGKMLGYRGYFYWVSGDRKTSGNEYFTGIFDRWSGKLRLNGYKVRNIRGELGTGDYEASVRKGRTIRGGWAGDNAIPGKWSARRLGRL